MLWEFNLPVKIVFGSGKRKELNKYIDEIEMCIRDSVHAY